MYSYVICMSLERTRMPSACQSYVLVCNGTSLARTRISSVCHSRLLVFHPYVTRMYSCVIRMSLVCTRMSSLCHMYVLVCHPYVICMWFYHEPYLHLSIATHYFKPIENCYIKLTIYIITTLTCFLKMYVIGKCFFYNSGYFESHFQLAFS